MSRATGITACLALAQASASAQAPFPLSGLSAPAQQLADSCSRQLSTARRNLLGTYPGDAVDKLLRDTLEEDAHFDSAAAKADLARAEANGGPAWSLEADRCLVGARLQQIERSVQRTAPTALSVNEASGCLEFATAVAFAGEQPQLQGVLLNHCDFRVTALWCVDARDCANGFTHHGDFAPNEQTALGPPASGEYDAKWAACRAGPGFGGDRDRLARALQHTCN